MMERLGARRLGNLQLALGTALSVLAIDQISKNWARDNLQGVTRHIIGDWLRLNYAENPGAAFSSFTDAGQIIGVIAIVVTAVLVFMINNTDKRPELIALGLILGGALGNLTDRVFRGSGVLDGNVVDWIDWWFVPTFNIADAALNVGVILLLFSVLVLHRRHE
jgi:signal peptidase II